MRLHHKRFADFYAGAVSRASKVFASATVELIGFGRAHASLLGCFLIDQGSANDWAADC